MAKKLLLIIALIVFSISCVSFDMNNHKINAYLENDALIWLPNKETGDKTIKGLFKDQIGLEKIKDGDWYEYLYSIPILVLFGMDYA